MNIFLRSGNEDFPALTGIRWLGATIVFLIHLQIGFAPVNVLPFFFVLSGFLIVYIYYEQFKVNRKWITGYFVNRFARIYPVYFALLIVAILLKPNFDVAFLIKNFTLTHALFNSNYFAIEPSWSLTVEETFYCFAPLIIILTKRYNIYVPLLIAILLLTGALYISRLNINFLHKPTFVFNCTFFGYFLNFFAGAYLALLILRSGSGQKIEGFKLTYCGLFLITICMVVSVYITGLPKEKSNMLQIVTNNFIIPFPIGIFYFGLIRENTIISRLLSMRFVGLLGRSSYAFYLVHTLIIDYIATPVLRQYLSNTTLYTMLVYTLTTVISVLIYLFYEQPLNRLIRSGFRSNIVADKTSVAGSTIN